MRLALPYAFASLLMGCAHTPQDETDIFTQIISELESLEAFEIVECTTQRTGVYQVCFEESHANADAQPLGDGYYRGFSQGFFSIKQFFELKENWNVVIFDNGWISFTPNLHKHLSLNGFYRFPSEPGHGRYLVRQESLSPVDGLLKLDVTHKSKHTLYFKTIPPREAQ